MLVSLIAAFIIGFHIENVKVKKYEMVNEKGETLKVQFSKNSKYSCPLSCSIDHYHYTEKISESKDEDCWNVKYSDKNKTNREYSINGSLISSYKEINIKRLPKSIPVPTVSTASDN